MDLHSVKKSTFPRGKKNKIFSIQNITYELKNRSYYKSIGVCLYKIIRVRKNN